MVGRLLAWAVNPDPRATLGPVASLLVPAAIVCAPMAMGALGWSW